jgi:hypothetical protein
MFQFIFRKKSTIFLLIAIILISLVFSILLHQPLHEGFDEATINSPSPDIIHNMIVIVNDSAKDKMNKLLDIKGLIGNKYKVLGDIYTQNENALVKELDTYLTQPPKQDNTGNLLDVNALTGGNREKAVNILYSNETAVEKIGKIKTLAGQDKSVNVIIDKFLDEWLKMVVTNVNQIQTTMNNVVNPLPLP